MEDPRIQPGQQITHFQPSSPLLLSNRFHHIRHTEDGEQAGNPNRTMEETLAMGTCRSLVLEPTFANGVFSIHDEISSLPRLPLSPLQIQNSVFGGEDHEAFFNSTYQLCQPDNGSNHHDNLSYNVQVFSSTRGEPIGDQKWNQAISAAKDSGQAAAVGICYEVLEGHTADIHNCASHFVTILGKRRSGDGYQVLVRDSYVHSTLPDGAAYYSTDGNDRNDFWISENAIKAVTTTFQIISAGASLPEAPPAPVATGAAASSTVAKSATAATGPSKSQDVTPVAEANPSERSE